MFNYFPSNFTIGENMKLTRQLFPLIFQYLLVFCDFTIDAARETTIDEILEKELIKDKYVKFAEKQNVVITKMKEILDLKEIPSDEQLDDVYKEIRDLDQNGYQ